MANQTNSVIGVNFSNTFQSNPISPSQAAQLISATGVTMVKMFTYDQDDCISAFVNANLQVLIGIPNGDLSNIANNDSTTINKIVSTVQQYQASIPFVLVGNEPLGSWWNGEYDSVLAPAYDNLKQALTRANCDNKLTVPFNFGIMGNSYPPSAGTLGPKAKIVISICSRLLQDGSVFMINIYPFLDIHNDPTQINLNYCLFTAENDPNVWVHDGNYTYKNIFDASYDALYVALNEVGYGNLPIAIGECGWPTQGDPNATIQNARTFNQNLINHCLSGNGTPRLPNRQINCFIFEMYDEDTKSTDPGPWEPYWGVCRKDGFPKYQLNWKSS